MGSAVKSSCIKQWLLLSAGHQTMTTTGTIGRALWPESRPAKALKLATNNHQSLLSICLGPPTGLVSPGSLWHSNSIGGGSSWLLVASHGRRGRRGCPPKTTTGVRFGLIRPTQAIDVRQRDKSDLSSRQSKHNSLPVVVVAAPVLESAAVLPAVKLAQSASATCLSSSIGQKQLTSSSLSSLCPSRGAHRCARPVVRDERLEHVRRHRQSSRVRLVKRS